MATPNEATNDGSNAHHILSEQNVDHLCWLVTVERDMLHPFEESVNHALDAHHPDADLTVDDFGDDMRSDKVAVDIASKAENTAHLTFHLVDYGLDVYARGERYARILGTYEKEGGLSDPPEHGEWAFDKTFIESSYEEMVEEDVDPTSQPYEIDH
jgi:hypothetical protein